MQNRRMMIGVLIAGAACAFALGIVSAPRLGALLGLDSARRPVLAVSLDLLERTTELQQEKARLETALGESRERAAALESRIAALGQDRGAELARREAELDAARKLISALKTRAAELDGARQQNAALSEKIEGLRRARDRARKASAALARQQTDLRAALQNNAAMETKMEGLRRARDEADEASAAQLRTIEILRRDLAALGDRHESRQRALNAEISALRETIEGKDREIARLRRTLEDAEQAPPVAAAPPAAPAPAAPAPKAQAKPEKPPQAVTGVLAGAAAYRATDYARAYEIWRPLAERGNARAQFHVGALYYEGRGVAKDFDKARAWLERAAANGSEPAAALLARMDEERLAKGRATP